MAREKVKDSKGREFEIDFPDDDDPPAGDGDGGGDGDNILEIPEEAIEWLVDQFNQSKATNRQRSSSGTRQTPPADNKVIRIRGKQASAGSQSSNNQTRRRVLKIG